MVIAYYHIKTCIIVRNKFQAPVIRDYGRNLSDSENNSLLYVELDMSMIITIRPMYQRLYQVLWMGKTEMRKRGLVSFLRRSVNTEKSFGWNCLLY